MLLIYRVVAPSEMFDEMARAEIIVLDYVEDLNRLYVECVWDREAMRWEKR